MLTLHPSYLTTVSAELASTYAALILADEGIEISVSRC